MRRLLRGGLIVAVASALAGGVVAAGTANGDNGNDNNNGNHGNPHFCDAKCLRYQTTLYLQAITLGSTQSIPAAGGPNRQFPGLQIAPNVVVTDNSKPSTVGASAVWTHHIV